MNPKVKLALVLLIPVGGVFLRIISLFSLLSPADIAPSETKQGASTGIVLHQPLKEIRNSQNLLSGSVTSGVKIKTIKTLTLAMPIQMYNEPGRRPIISKLKQQHVNLSIVTNQRNQRYEDYVVGLFSSGSSGADIVLLHNDLLKTYAHNAGSFGFSQDISGLFPYVFYPYFQNKEYSMIPFAIDPMVTYSKNALDGNIDNLEWADIVNGVSTSTEDDIRKLAVQIPILFGISPLDIQLLKNKKEAFNGYVDILKNILYQSSNRSDLIENIKKFSDDRLEDYKFWDYAKYKRIVAKLVERNAKCETYPDLCFMYYKLTSFRFGYLSDLDIVNKYFQTSDYKIYNFPNSSSVYPVRLWGWIVNNKEYDRLVRPDEDGLSLAGSFFQEYILQATNGNQYLRPTLFSAFNVVLEQQTSDLQRKYIAQYKNKFQINPINIDTDQKLEQVLALIQQEYDIHVFLAGLGR